MADVIRERRVWVPSPRDAVFAFFADPAHLAVVTPSSMRLTLLGPVAPMEAGAVFEYRLRWLGLPLRWRTFIREYDPPFRFIAVQVRGPCARWEHRHIFLEEEGGTWIDDRVLYRMPFGPVGRAAHALVVRRQIEATWRVRDRAIAEQFGPISRPSAT